MKVLWFAVLFFASLCAHAIPITGLISYNGLIGANITAGPSGHDWSNATAFGSIESQWSARTDDFAQWSIFGGGPLLNLHLGDTEIQDYWGGTLYQGNDVIQMAFDLTSITIETGDGFFRAYGSGVARMTGFEDTLATWEVNATHTGPHLYGLYMQNSSFTALGIPVQTFMIQESTSIVPVSDAGSTTLLLALALGGLAALRFRDPR